MPYGIDKDLGGDSPENVKWMENCVNNVMHNTKDRKPMDKGNAIAICKSMFRKHKGNTQKAESDLALILDLYLNSRIK